MPACAGMALGQPVQGIPAQGLTPLQSGADGSGMSAHAGMHGYIHDPSSGVPSSCGITLLPLSPTSVSSLAPSPLRDTPEERLFMFLLIASPT